MIRTRNNNILMPDKSISTLTFANKAHTKF